MPPCSPIARNCARKRRLEDGGEVGEGGEGNSEGGGDEGAEGEEADGGEEAEHVRGGGLEQNAAGRRRQKRTYVRRPTITDAQKDAEKRYRRTDSGYEGVLEERLRRGRDRRKLRRPGSPPRAKCAAKRSRAPKLRRQAPLASEKCAAKPIHERAGGTGAVARGRASDRRSGVLSRLRAASLVISVLNLVS